MNLVSFKLSGTGPVPPGGNRNRCGYRVGRPGRKEGGVHHRRPGRRGAVVSLSSSRLLAKQKKKAPTRLIKTETGGRGILSDPARAPPSAALPTSSPSASAGLLYTNSSYSRTNYYYSAPGSSSSSFPTSPAFPTNSIDPAAGGSTPRAPAGRTSGSHGVRCLHRQERRLPPPQGQAREQGRVPT